ETQLMGYDQVKEAVVIAKENETGDKYLIAYIVGAFIETPQLKKYLSQTLPVYMIPPFFVQMEKIPLTPNGKVDRKALPDPEREAGESYVAPRDETETKLVAIWADVLGLKPGVTGIDAGFFELGGHSLKATKMASMIHKAFDVKIPLAELFKLQTIRRLADFIKEAESETFTGIEPVKESDYYDLSYNQMRLWFILQQDPENVAFNMPGVFTWNSPVVAGIVKESLLKVMERHESLRSAFIEREGKPVQFIKKSLHIDDVPLKQVDISHLNDEEKEHRRRMLVEEESRTPFDLSRLPLFRAILVKWAGTGWDFIFNIHHIVSDGWSQQLLRQDFITFYRALQEGRDVQMEPLPLQYKDFAAWQNRRANDPDFKERAHRFWKKRLAGGIPVPQLPTNAAGRVNTGAADREGAGYLCILDKDLKDLLVETARQNNTTLFTVMFSTFLLLFSDFSNQEEVSCSIIDAGREHVDLGRIIGFFINPIPFGTRVEASEIFSRFLTRINREVLEVFQYKSYPVELVLDELKMKYFEIPIAFNMLNIKENTAGKALEPFEPYHLPEAREIKFDIEVYVTEYENGIEMHWAYRKSLFAPETAAFIAAEFIKLMEYFVKDTGMGLRDYRGAGKKRRFKRRKKTAVENQGEPGNADS
ncbi:MAG: hypothetical protein GY950_29925, partial [bacterium]|nr:hypothetical protein [bacterium]